MPETVLVLLFASALCQTVNSKDLRKKIVVLLSRVPYPLEKGDKLRAFHQIRELSKRHDLVICALSDIPPDPHAYNVLKEYASSVYFFHLSKMGIYLRLLRNIFSAKPFQVAYFFKKSIRSEIHEIIRKYQPDHIYCQLIRTAEYAKEIDIDKTIDYQDVFSFGLKRRLEIAPWYGKLLLNAEYKRVMRYEEQVFGWFNKKTIISGPDREMIPHPDRNQIIVIPNGVDTGYFHPIEMEKSFDIVFTGNMSYPPNINGAEYLVKDIMPIVWSVLPGARLAIAGAAPSHRVRLLASDRVVVTGWVDDIRTYYASSRVFIAPMRIGTGLQNKILEAMAMQIPCVCSPLANKALNGKPGIDLLVGNNAKECAQHVLSLLQNEQVRYDIAQKGYKFVLQNFNWEGTSLKLAKILTA